MTIKELLSSAQFENIVFYMNELGFTSPYDLSSFNYDDLYFVPGISNVAIEQCKNIINEYIQEQKLIEEQAPQHIVSNMDNLSKTQTSYDRSQNYDDLSVAISDLITSVSAAVDAVGNHKRLEMLREVLLSNPDRCNQYDYSLLLLLCDEIDALLIIDTPQKAQISFDSSQNCDDPSVAISNLTASVSAAVEAVGNHKRLEILRDVLSSNPDCCNQYDNGLLFLLCDEIDALIFELDREVTGTKQPSHEKYGQFSSVTVEDIFAGIPRCTAILHFCKENGIKTLLDLDSLNFSRIRVKGLSPSSLKNFEKAFLAKRAAVLAGKTIASKPKIIPQQWFAEEFSKLKVHSKECLIARAQGATLQAIGEKLGISRERVRQITDKTVRKLSHPCEAVLKELTSGRLSICTPDLKVAFNSQIQIDVFTYVMKNIHSVCYFEFADKYVISGIVPEDWKYRLSQIAEDIVGASINYYENLELIDERLSSDGLSFINAIDYMGYLLENGYKALGDYVIKKTQTYKNICLYVIRRYFQEGIKLDSDENNSDIMRLRSIVQKEFGAAGLPISNRALTARIVPSLVLCNRGRYISSENVVADISLIEQIVDYINASSETSLYYTEIFSAFSGRLLAQTNIDNPYFLHGVLKHYYPDDFYYERDLIVKPGMERVSFESRLAQLLKNNHQPMKKTEIQSKILGATDFLITNALVRLPELIQWDYNEYNHMDNVYVTNNDVETLGTILKVLTDEQSGYCSESRLYTAVLQEMPEFIRKNSIQNSHALFYISSYFFRKRYRFSRPHIASDEFPSIALTNANVARIFIGDVKTFTYPDLVEMSNRAGWSNGTFTLILNAVEKDYCRISLNEYILRADFHIGKDSLLQIKMATSELLAASGYYGLFAIYNFDTFPPLSFEWNEFLLQTVLEEYDLGFKILEPNSKDRRYKRGIIVSTSCPCSSFEEFVIYCLKADHIQAIPEEEFSSYLRKKGLVLTTNVPQELYDGDGVRLENGVFTYG